MKRLTILTSALVALATLIIGCGTDSVSPVASSADADLQPQTTARIAFQTLTSAGKIAADDDDDDDGDDDDDLKKAEKEAKKAKKAKKKAEENRKESQRDLDKNRSDIKTIGPEGGTINVGHKNLNHGPLSLKVQFHVPEGALNEEVPITMNLVGNTLEELVVEFGPAGLVFNTPARLTLLVGKDRTLTDLDGLVILHVHSDGTVEEVRWSLDEAEQGYRIDIAVPGFSRYSSGGGW